MDEQTLIVLESDMQSISLDDSLNGSKQVGVLDMEQALSEYSGQFLSVPAV